MRRFVRTCQECNKRIETKDPASLKGGVTESYHNRACPKCGSEAFDYGSWQNVDALLNHIEEDYTKED